MDSFHAVKLFAFVKEMEFDAETGSILQGETSKEDTKKENLVEEGKNVEENYDAKQENMKKVYRGN